MTAPTETPTALSAATESQRWLEQLGDGGASRDAAVSKLHALLLKAARFEIDRRRAGLPHLRGGDYEDLAQQSADDALVAVLAKLDQFRGESRFTTWAYKFALLVAAVKLRRLAWQGREVPLEEDAWSKLAAATSWAGRGAEDAELFTVLRDEIENGLSPRQREVLVAVALNDVPIDVLAERLGSTRGALYKSLHDARRKLRAALRERGIERGLEREEER
jgi:RNA polymerase sigma-70 factor (ECF subfamily)